MDDRRAQASGEPNEPRADRKIEALFAELRAIDTPTITPTIDVIAVFMNELVADYRSEKIYETRDGRYVATNGPMVAMLGGIISDCF